MRSGRQARTCLELVAGTQPDGRECEKRRNGTEENMQQRPERSS